MVTTLLSSQSCSQVALC